MALALGLGTYEFCDLSRSFGDFDLLGLRVNI